MVHVMMSASVIIFVVMKTGLQGSQSLASAHPTRVIGAITGRTLSVVIK
jgi:hypothetical protein